MESTINFITTVGFPIVAYLLLYMDLRKVVNGNTKTLERLTNVIAKEGLNVQDIKTGS